MTPTNQRQLSELEFFIVSCAARLRVLASSYDRGREAQVKATLLDIAVTLERCVTDKYFDEQEKSLVDWQIEKFMREHNLINP